MRNSSVVCVFFCGLAVLLACVPTLAWGQATFPYKAYVTADNVYIRSGPGQGYYPTDKVKAGRSVEVYRHDPGGWCAIRPPRGSFTWVSRRYLEPVGQGLARVTSPRVAARVGSRFSSIRDIIQVRLHQDETVELLPDSRENTDSEWARISPPSGEFRWIHSKYLDPEYPVDGVRRPPNRLETNGSELADQAGHNGFHKPRHGEQPNDRHDRKATPPRPLATKEFQRRLDDIDLELSVMVVEEPSVWHFDELVLDAERLVTQAETALERGRAKMLLGKIERFENIKQRYDAVERVVAQTNRRERRLTALADNNAPARPSMAQGRFDGRGRLTRVRSAKPGSPRYALVDDSGRITCYVTPSPGVNLRHYEQRQVGVTGTRGYMPQQRAYHVMASHIDLLDRRQLR